MTSGPIYNVDWINNDVVDMSASYITAMDSGPGSPGHIWAAQINPDGSLASDIFYMPVPSRHSSWSPSIYGNSVVWMDGRNGQWEIYMATLDGATVSRVRRLTNNNGSHHNHLYPRIYGDNVGWQTRHPNNSLVFGLDGMNIETGERYTIHSGTAWLGNIYENMIVYSASGPNSDIYIYDILTQTSRKITDDSSYQAAPDIYGDTVVWQDNRNGNFDIYSYNLVTEKETQITDNEFDQKQPNLFGNTVVWVDYRDGISIYGAIVPPSVINEPPVADSGGPYYGNEGSPITFNASASDDPDGDTLQYRWDFDNDGTWDTPWSESPTASRTWDDDWEGTAKVEVSDGELTDTDPAANVTVNNVAPVVRIDAVDQQTAAFILPYDLLIFTGSFADPGADSHTIEWNFGDGTVEVDAELISFHEYTEPGVFAVTLTVRDDDGDEGVASIEIVVESPAGATGIVIDDIEELGLPQGTENSLTSKLKNAIASLGSGQDDAAVNKLEAFINQVQAQVDKKANFTQEAADKLIADVRAIIDGIQDDGS